MVIASLLAIVFGALTVFAARWFPAASESISLWGGSLFLGGLVLGALAAPMM